MSEILDTLESSDDVVLYAQDETYIRIESNNRRLWSPIGHPPILEKNAMNQGINAIGATEILKNFDTIIDVYPSTKSITSKEITAFLEKLIEINQGKKVYVVWDNAGTHISKHTTDFLQDHKDELEVIYLPKYSPTMNPQENLWNNLKAKLFRPSARSSVDELIYDTFKIYNEYNYHSDIVRSLTIARSFLV